jgi:hypothetical protein
MPALNHILITFLPKFIDSRFSGTIVSKYLGSGSSRSSEPTTKSFREIYSSILHGPATRAAEAYDDGEEMEEIRFGWKGDEKGGSRDGERVT